MIVEEGELVISHRNPNHGDAHGLADLGYTFLERIYLPEPVLPIMERIQKDIDRGNITAMEPATNMTPDCVFIIASCTRA